MSQSKSVVVYSAGVAFQLPEGARVLQGFPASLVTAREFKRVDGRTAYFADGPEGHKQLLVRFTPEAAVRDGLAYFFETRELANGHWVIKGL